MNKERCRKCMYSAKISGFCICDYLGHTGRARSSICTIDNCTEYRTKPKRKVADLTAARQRGAL